MRGIKAILLLIAFAMLAWALVNVAQLALGIYPDFRVWHLGAALGILYAGADLFDRQREWLGRGNERRPYRQAWRGWRG